MTPEIAISRAGVADAGEILTVQRAAYVTEAQLYGDVRLPALTQTLEELVAELASSLCLKATLAGRLVGAVRGRVDGEVLHVGRLIVVPDLQGRGIGSRLLLGIEEQVPDGVSRLELFTGHLSVANLRLYERFGYRETRREPLTAGVELVHLAKPVS
jgi:GNAT superfamily N-acetyltransferase